MQPLFILRAPYLCSYAQLNSLSLMLWVKYTNMALGLTLLPPSNMTTDEQNLQHRFVHEPMRLLPGCTGARKKWPHFSPSLLLFRQRIRREQMIRALRGFARKRTRANCI